MSAFEDIPAEPDRVTGWAIQSTVACVAIAIAACVFVVWLVLGRRMTGGGRSAQVELHTMPPGAPFSEPTPAELERGAQLLELGRWQWADREHHRVVLPVGIAIDRYLEQRSAP